MNPRNHVSVWTLGLWLTASACGGSQPPAESPEQTPAANDAGPAESGDSEPAAGQHTMPDGTTMPGDYHDEGTSAPATDEKSE